MNDDAVTITVYGRPVPQGSKRHVGRGVMVESSKGLKDWRHDVTLAARDVMGARMPLQGPVVLNAVFTVPKPKSAPKKRKTWPIARPDVDKLLRGVCDALTAAAVWSDDSQIVQAMAVKTYPNETPNALHAPGAHLIVIPLESQ